jgi:hypothetical protein
MRLWGLASVVVFAMAASSASGAAATPVAVVATRLLVPSSAPAAEPAPDEPEPAPSEVEPPPSVRIEPTLIPRITQPIAVEPRRYSWPLWRVLTGSALVVGGGVMFGFGLSAFAFDGVCVPAPPAGVLACRRYYDTYSKGVALVTAGTLTAVAGALMATIPSRRARLKVSAQLQLPSIGISLWGSY